MFLVLSLNLFWVCIFYCFFVSYCLNTYILLYPLVFELFRAVYEISKPFSHLYIHLLTSLRPRIHFCFFIDRFFMRDLDTCAAYHSPYSGASKMAEDGQAPKVPRIPFSGFEDEIIH